MRFNVEITLEDTKRIAVVESGLSGPEDIVKSQAMNFAVTSLPEMIADLLDHPDWVVKPKPKSSKK